jgi:ATP-dependent RNA helicase DDX47/RRP3
MLHQKLLWDRSKSARQLQKVQNFVPGTTNSIIFTMAPETSVRQNADIKKKRKHEDARSQDDKPKKKSRPSPPPAEISSEPESENDDVAETVAREDEAVVDKTFADLGIIDSLCEACDKMGFKKPTPIQEQAIPVALQGRDVIGLAETGSGKTAAFALPILQALMDKPSPLFGLVLAPTRELAYQTSQQFEAIGSVIGVRCATIVGGMDMVAQSIALSKKPHIVVATPGRLLDHLESTKGFSLRTLKYLVMDEADRLLDLDFGPVLDKILKVLPREGRHTYLFSATLSSKVESLQRASLQNPVRVSISSTSRQTVATLIQKFILIPHKHKDLYLVHLLSDMFSGLTTIIFTRTQHETQRLAFLCRALGLEAIPIHGGMSQSSRMGALSKFRSKSRKILVATDVAARGLDIPSVDLILNFDLPDDSATYVHRVGRTARAGKSGKAISFVTQYDAEVFLRIEHALGRKLEELEGVEREVAMTHAESVGEAQRSAKQSMREIQDAKNGAAGGRGRGGRGGRGGGRGGRGGRDRMDQDDG